MQTQHATPPKVFICHSHDDRHMAVRLQKIIESGGVRTFLDQDRIEPLDNLPQRVRNGIEWADHLLLVWSANAAASDWVQREWQSAQKAGKKIVPYVLDPTPLPFLLDELVYVDKSDLGHGNAQLLKAIGGRAGEGPFPGLWEASVDALGMARGTYRLELRANGQVEGDGGISDAGAAGALARQLGAGDVLSTRVPVHGSWSYDEGTQYLTIDIVAEAFGRQQHDTIRIHATGRERGAVTGEDLGGRQWTLRRVGERATSSREVERQRVRDALQMLYDRNKETAVLPTLLAATCIGAQQASPYDLGLPTKKARRLMQADATSFADAWRDFAQALESGHWIS